MRNLHQLLALATICTAGLSACTQGSTSKLRDATAPTASSDATAAAPGAVGPYQIFEQDYHLPAQVNERILSDRKTELWARLYMPAQGQAPGALPVLVFLHGNHATCGHGDNPRIDDRTDYSMTGTCPDGYVVTPNHRGYDYLARNMASWGFAVISINANLGINTAPGVDGDSGLNLARGRLVLSHLELLSKWNQQGGSQDAAGIDLKGRLDFSHVGMMGHSRGGEGVRAAYAQYHDAGSTWPSTIGPLNVRGIFEIAPVDGQTGRTLDAMNTAWNVMVGLCDGDVSDFQGVKPFDRMLKQTHEDSINPKSTLVVWGANHNFFNTEWQTSDSTGCDDHTPIFDPNGSNSAKQQQIALESLTAFFRNHVGGEADVDLGRYFDPSVPMPSNLTAITPFGRDFVLSPDASQTVHLVDIPNDGQAPVGTTNNATVTLGQVPFHDDRSGVQIVWQGAGAGDNVILNAAAATDLSHAATLDLDLQASVAGPGTDFDLKLVTAAGDSAAVALSDVLAIQGASGRNLFQTARIPLAKFTGVQLNAVTGVKLVFDKSQNGTIIVGGVRASTSAASADVAGPVVDGALHLAAAGTSHGFVGQGQVTDAQLAQGGGAAGPNGQVQRAVVQLTVQSPDKFPVRDQLPVLHVGNQTYDLSGYGSGTLDTLVFNIPAAQFRTLAAGAQVLVSYGALATSTYVINAGTLSNDIVTGVQ